MSISKRLRLFLELMLSQVFDHAGYPDLRPNYNAEDLLNLAQSIRPGRIDNVSNKITKFKGWEFYSSSYIIDRVYSLDRIIKVLPSNELIGFDFTGNINELESKCDKLQTFQPLWESIGVKRVIVVGTALPAGDDAGIAFLDMDKCVDDLLEVIYNAIELDLVVSTATIQLVNK